MDPIEELARREANKEKAQPYIERRLALGLSKAGLAQKAGVDKTTVGGMESGRCWPVSAPAGFPTI